MKITLNVGETDLKKLRKFAKVEKRTLEQAAEDAFQLGLPTYCIKVIDDVGHRGRRPVWRGLKEVRAERALAKKLRP